MNDLSIGVSVIVCCFNSAKRLPKTLSHLANQNVDSSIPWEVIIIDNNSYDETNVVVKEFISSNLAINIKLVEETTPGLSYARKKGIESSRFEYIIMCDDDNWFHENYLQTVFTIFQENSEIGIVGGIGEAVSDVPLPSWFNRKENTYAVGTLFNGGIVKYVYGAGMGLRKSIYLKAVNNGFISLLSDRKGKELSSGGDLELCYIFKFLGFKVYQSEKLRFKHFIDNKKLTKNYNHRLNIGFAKTLMTLRPYDLVANGRKEKPCILWMKDYAYILKDAMQNIFNKKEDWTYLKNAIQLMALKKKSYCRNVDIIRQFAINNNYEAYNE